MSESELHPQWKAPSGDGQLLIWPEPRTIQRQTLENQKLLSNAHQVRLQGIPLPEVRAWIRKWVDADAARPLVAAAHQVELSHPGVWAKNILIDELAKKVDGVGYQFSVDTDAPKHLVVKWPGGGRPITDDLRMSKAAWVGLLDAPTPRHLQQIEAELGGAAGEWGFRPIALEFLQIVKRLTLEVPRVAPLLISALHELDWSLGLRHSAMAAEPLWGSEGYLLCVHHLASSAGDFAAIYNSTLAEYRREQGINSAGRPWPDLAASSEHVELPFWLDCLESGERLRAAVNLRGDAAVLEVPKGEGFVFRREAKGWDAAENLKKYLSEHRLRLAPRALALTMFLRLMVVDQLVHGIGGAMYDEVTDRVMRRRLGIEPPKFCVTTATLLFPGAVGRERVRLEPLLKEGRRLRHGYHDTKKSMMAWEIDAAPRGSAERARKFYEMHAYLASLQQGAEFQGWVKRFEEAKKRLHEEKDVFDRELFYGIQPEGRLRGLIERYQAELG
jgi:hypothetical protein